MRIRYTIEGTPQRGAAAFLPRPVGGGHTTPASTTHGSVEIFAGKRMQVAAPRPNPVLPPGSTVGSTVNSYGGPEVIIPMRYVTTAAGMGPRVEYHPGAPRPIPVPARQEVPLASLAMRRATMGGSTENTPWPKTFQSFTRKAKS